MKRFNELYESIIEEKLQAGLLQTAPGIMLDFLKTEFPDKYKKYTIGTFQADYDIDAPAILNPRGEAEIYFVEESGKLVVKIRDFNMVDKDGRKWSNVGKEIRGNISNEKNLRKEINKWFKKLAQSFE